MLSMCFDQIRNLCIRAQIFRHEPLLQCIIHFATFQDIYGPFSCFFIALFMFFSAPFRVLFGTFHVLFGTLSCSFHVLFGTFHVL